MEDRTDPWVRAELELFNVETLALVPEGLREDYTRIMKQLAHAKGIAALALEQVYLAENERHAFFEPFTKTTPSPEPTAFEQQGGTFTPNNNTKPPEGGVCGLNSTGGSQNPDYTPVTDLSEYRKRHGD